MRAFMICRNFSVNGGMLARNGIVQGLPADDQKNRRRQKLGSRTELVLTGPHPHRIRSRRSISPTTSFESSEYLLPSRAGASSHQATEPQPPSPGLDKTSVVSEATAMPDPGSTSVLQLANAISAHDYNMTQWLLEHRFQQVATGEYSWLTELQSLGYSFLEMTDELLEKAILGPWIFEPFTPLDPPLCHFGFHIRPCVHFPGPAAAEASMPKARDSKTLTWDLNATAPVLTAKESIEYYCGLAGVRPEPEGSTELQHGAVSLSEDMSVATVALVGPEDYSALLQVLENLEFAAGTLQTLGGCCDSFTFLFVVEEAGPHVELHKIHFSAIRQLREYVGRPQRARQYFVGYLLKQIMPFLADNLVSRLRWSSSDNIRIHIAPLAAQFLALALLSYAQAHCGPIMPFFLDTPLSAVILKGSGQVPRPNTPNTSIAEIEVSEIEVPEIEVCGSLVLLTCMGEMTGKPVFAFQYAKFYQERLKTDQSLPKMNLVASIEDVLDTWGPGAFVPESPDNPEGLLVSVSVGDGTITSAEPRTAGDRPRRQLHWSRGGLKLPGTKLKPFLRHRKYIIAGTTIIENTQCAANPDISLQNAIPLLQELGTFPTYWHPAERELGVGLHGSGYAALQFSQTWVKMQGITKKSALLRQPAVFLSDLDSFFGVQVSVCTGIARRVRLRDLLADLLPTYVASLLAPPPLYASLVPVLLPALRGSDSLGTLDHAHQSALQDLVLAVLNLLRDTGVDPRITGSDATLVVACIQPGLPFQCFKIPCRASSYWARMLADSEDTATFAYVTTQCLETEDIRCGGGGGGGAAAWRNEAALLWTAVSCDEERIAGAVAAQEQRWGLRHADAYLIGRADAALAVRVHRPNDDDEPRLLASCSTIPAQYLHRIFRRARPGKAKRLREMKCFDQRAESVVVLVGGAEGGGLRV